MRSNKPGAERFQHWVFHDVLPTLRKTGKYETTPPSHASDQFPELQAIIKLVESTAEARLLAHAAQTMALEAKAESSQAQANALRAMETQSFFTVAEYIAFNKLAAQVPRSAYKSCSDHLRSYCMDKAIPFRKQPIGGKTWEDEYAFHVSTYAEAFPGWLKRTYTQATLRMLRRS